MKKGFVCLNLPELLLVLPAHTPPWVEGPTGAITLRFLGSTGQGTLASPRGNDYLSALGFSLSLESPGTIKQFYISLVAAATVHCANVPQCSPAPALWPTSPWWNGVQTKNSASTRSTAAAREPSPWLLLQWCWCHCCTDSASEQGSDMPGFKVCMEKPLLCT